ncbi:MAG TPA: bifunctional 5,10-methylenetetrahydrofolate dehydrogenase/5,10-methenyltetrahydrofolate cyclohydrolase [Solirubrobacteraceae bacterium]|nr:bifunctional 5,10-methylenetetrahydrofolate dehydrogenase/5,10-methenyltetrahydrofolate cyclohydrolase [Solirubrobacteraceae bacterium]
MSATIIDGKAIAARVRAQVAREVAELVERTARPPGLATVLVGEDPASAVYVGGKQRACAEVGMTPFDVRFPASATFDQVAERLEALKDDLDVDGVLLQLPLPGHLDGPALTGLIDPGKDVDGLTPVNAGLLSLGRPGLRPCTPSGVIELLASVDAELEGAEAVVVGRSNLFGKPMAQLLLEANATVTVCHSRTRDLREVCARADILIAAVGRPRLIEREFVKPGAIVIDVGMNRPETDRRSIARSGHTAGSPIVGAAADPDLRSVRPGGQAGSASGLVGDVDFEAVRDVACAITPVPGGVGPMTIAMLLRNTLRAARTHSGIDPHVGGPP